jgi:hypothetical protein
LNTEAGEITDSIIKSFLEIDSIVSEFPRDSAIKAIKIILTSKGIDLTKTICIIKNK